MVTPLHEALDDLAARFRGRIELQFEVARHWSGRADDRVAASGSGLEPGVLGLADRVASGLRQVFAMGSADTQVASLLNELRSSVILTWCSTQVDRRDLHFSELLIASQAHPELRLWGVELARARVIRGPLLDALQVAPLLGSGDALAAPENTEARARLEILIWEAGACALDLPFMGRWIWSDPSTFETLIHQPARAALRGRVLAARCLEISASGLPARLAPDRVADTLQVLQPLLLHPEPLVWVHAARALGRLTGHIEQLEGTLLDWVQGHSRVLRPRAITAFASLPARRLQLLSSQLVALIDESEKNPLALASVAAATPDLFFERRPLWDRMAEQVLAGAGGAIAARSLARGLATLWRRGEYGGEIRTPLLALREMARQARPATLDESRQWTDVTAITDVVDSAERDPLDLELGLENLIRLAAQYDDEEADARAARFASAIAPAFAEAHRNALSTGRLRHRASAINALEACARAFALRLWSPMLATRVTKDGPEEPALDETWQRIARAPAEILDWVKEARLANPDATDELTALEILAVRLGGYALDACGADSDLGPGRGPTAHEICRWLRKIEGLVDGSRELPEKLKPALSSLFWRLVDTTRGTALGEVDDIEWLGPFAAWWALVIDRPAVLVQLATALPMMAAGVLDRCCEWAEMLRKAIAERESEISWYEPVSAVLRSLKANDTELAHALAALASALECFRGTAGAKPDLEAQCLELVLAGERLHGALADPVKGLHAAISEPREDSLTQRVTQNAPRVAALVARSIRARDVSLLEVWFASLGPVASSLLEEAIRGAIRRTAPPRPSARAKQPRVIKEYELIRPLGEGGMGSVWLVRKSGAERFFVLKIPKADALANATDDERAATLATFEREAQVLAGLYHPNVANIIDRGVVDGIPFLVLEYLIGADLKAYSGAQLMSLFELRQVVQESCAGLAALHGAGLVHRDIKPANIWLRLPLPGGEKFDPKRHRDPARVPPLAAVVIDFGMVRAIKVPPDASGRFVAGTVGYIAPEQVLDPIELDPRSDVYSLAGAIYNVTTGRAFFDEFDNSRDRILAHMQKSPFDEVERLRPYPAGIAKLLRAATQMDPRDRPWPLEFGREFAAAI